MRKLALVVNVALVMGVAGLGMARAQGDEATDDQSQAPAERQHIQVLHDPHDIASFYRSSQGSEFGPLFPMDENGSASRYPIASFYRNEGSRSLYGYSRFWTNGYGWGAGVFRGPMLHRRYGRFGRRIGQNGDIFLLAPTFLAPVGPLAGVFVER